MLNKNIKFLIGLIIVMLFPLVSFADVVSYANAVNLEVIVINTDGTIFYSLDDSEIEEIPYNTTLLVEYEEDESDSEKIGLQYHDKRGYIYKKDIMLKYRRYAPNIEINRFNKKEYYVFGNGAYLYQGPSESFAKALDEEIPVGTILEELYANDQFMYTEYNGVKGWIFIHKLYYQHSHNKQSALVNIDNRSIYTIDNVPIYDVRNIYYSQNLEEEGKVIGTIPAGQLLDIIYSYANERFETNFYINYNGITGWINWDTYYDDLDDNPFVVLTEQYFYGFSNVNVYNNKNLDNVIGTISGDQFIKNYFYGGNISDGISSVYLIEYDENKVGYISADDVKESYMYNNYYTISTSDTKLYFNLNNKNDFIIIPKNTIFEYYDYYDENNNEWYYVNYNDNKGWVDAKQFEDYYIDSTSIQAYDLNEEEKEKTSKNIFLYILGTIVLGLTTLVTIILINKKNKLNIEKLM